MSLEIHHLVIGLSVASMVFFLLGRRSMKNDLEYEKKRREDTQKTSQEKSAQIRELEKEIGIAQRPVKELRQKCKQLERIINEAVEDWQQQGALLPTLREWSARIQEEYDEAVVNNLKNRRPPAVKASEQVKEARQLARNYKMEVERLRPQLALYEGLAPWILEYSDHSLEELLEGIKEERELEKVYGTVRDPVAIFVPRSEWKSLSESQRNQLALDRYWRGDRRRTSWTAGIQYERFIGHRYEAKGYKVEYYGAINGVDDLGIDLICRRDDEVRIVQCKRLSVKKGIPVRENVIAQIYGAARFYQMDSEVKSVIPVLYTTFECSKTARLFGKYLGVRIFEGVPFQSYPSIKCNISRHDGARIYHLPFDQQYDRTEIGDVEGEFYATTVQEAEEAGFRRAYRWISGG